MVYTSSVNSLLAAPLRSAHVNLLDISFLFVGENEDTNWLPEEQLSVAPRSKSDAQIAISFVVGMITVTISEIQ